eukprot:tig00000381_g24531.t1
MVGASAATPGGPPAPAVASPPFPLLATVYFSAVCSSDVGETLCVGGSRPELGAFQSHWAVALWTDAERYPLWTGIVQLQLEGPDAEVEWRLVRRRLDHSFEWEPCDARRLRLSPGSHVAVRCRYGEPEVKSTAPDTDSSAAARSWLSLMQTAMGYPPVASPPSPLTLFTRRRGERFADDPAHSPGIDGSARPPLPSRVPPLTPSASFYTPPLPSAFSPPVPELSRAASPPAPSDPAQGPASPTTPRVSSELKHQHQPPAQPFGSPRPRPAARPPDPASPQARAPGPASAPAPAPHASPRGYAAPLPPLVPPPLPKSFSLDERTPLLRIPHGGPDLNTPEPNSKLEQALPAPYSSLLSAVCCGCCG